MSVDKFGRSSVSIARRRPLLKAYVDRSIAKVQLATAQSVRDSIETIVLRLHALTVQYLNQHLSTVDAELKQVKREINDTRQELTEINKIVANLSDRISAAEIKVDYRAKKIDEAMSDMRHLIIALESSSPVSDLKPTKPEFIIGEAEPASVLSIDASTEEIIIGEAEHTAGREINSSV